VTSRAALALAALLVLALAAPAEARRRQRRPASQLTIDGAATPVRWVDGDTFRVLDGPARGRSARLDGFNTLESYGPVHRFAGWDPRALLALSHAAQAVAAGGSWSCRARGGEDVYRRLLVTCPDLAEELVARGLAMVFAVDGPADPALLRAQAHAQRRGDGMWARGVPAWLVTSVHSAAERPDGAAHDRLVDTRSGAAVKRPHARVYATCEEVCYGDAAERSCMVYVPFERRFRGRPACLR
jgi:endonuclease YncB( thermonuclease family)